MEIFQDFPERVRKANLCPRPSKCKMGFDQVKFLGLTLQGHTTGKLHIAYLKTNLWGRILNTEKPKTKKSWRSLIGMTNIYGRYILNCAEVIAFLTELTKSRAPNYVESGFGHPGTYPKKPVDFFGVNPLLKNRQKTGPKQ